METVHKIVVLLVMLLLSVQQGYAQVQCYSTTDCSGTLFTTSVEGCCRDSATGLTFDTVGGGETCTRCFVYGWIRQDEDGNIIAQETITRDEGETVNLTIGYQKGALSAISPRVFMITTSGSAESSDYQLVSSGTQTLLINPITFTVQLLNDGVAAEEEKTLTLTLNEQLDQDRVENEFIYETVNIRIRDINIQTGFNVSNVTMEEGELIEIHLSTIGMPRGTITLTVGVELATADGEDFILVERQFTISNVDPEPFITFEAADDDVALEGIEKLFLTLSGTDVVSITNDRLEINIIDNDVVTFSFPEEDASEREDAGFFTVSVARDLETAKPVTFVATPVEYSVVNGTSIGENLPSVPEYDPFNPPTATASLDFNASEVVFTVPPGDDEFSIQVEIFEDAIFERFDEVFVLLLSFSDEPPTGAEISPQRNATLLTIRDNDPDPNFDFEQKNYTLAEADSNVVYNLTITRNASTELTYSIIIGVAGGTADAGDYSVPTDVFLFRPEDNNITVPITITGDDQVELTEDFFIQIGQDPSSPVFVVPAEPSYRIFIEDDDGDAGCRGTYLKCVTGSSDGRQTYLECVYDYILQFEQDTYDVNEGESISVCFIVTNPPPPKAEFQFQFNVTVLSSDETAQAGADYVAINATYTFMGSTADRQCVTLQTREDMFVEGNETLLIIGRVDDSLPVSFNNSATVTIIDDELVSLGFAETSIQVTEGGNTEICLMLGIGSAAELEKSIVVSVESSDGTARAGDDYTAVSEQFTFGPGTIAPPECVTTVTVDGAVDNVYEISENFTLTINTDDQSVDLSPDTATVTILDNTTVVVGFNETSVNVSEGGSEDVCAELSSMYSISGSPPATVELTPEFATGVGIAADDVTICVRPGCGSTLVFNSTQREVCLSAEVEDDNTVDAGESFSISLSTTQPRVNVANMVSFEVIDNDVEVGFNRTVYNTSESNGTVDICVRITNGTLGGRRLTVTVTTADGSAIGTTNGSGSAMGITADGDYIEGSYDITLTGGLRFGCTTIDIIADSTIEDEEEFSVALSIAGDGESFATVADGQARIIIARDPLLIGFNMTNYSTSEGMEREVCAVVNGSLERDATASIDVVGGTAEEGVDYATFDGSLSFMSGDTEACVNIRILPSPLVEREETIELQLTSTEPDAKISPDLAIVTIAGDGNVTVSFSGPSYEYPEGDTGFVVVVKNGTLDSSVTFRVFGTGLVNETRTFPAGGPVSAAIDVTFAIPDNKVALEMPEIFIVDLEITPPDPQVTLGIRTAEVIVIDDDEVTVGFTDTTSSFDESSGMIPFCVTKDRETARDIIFTISDTEITASRGEDYTVNQTVPAILSAGSVIEEVCFDMFVRIIDDNVYLEGNESFELSLSFSVEPDIVDPATHIVTIVDNDVSPMIRLSGPETIGEGDGNATYCISTNCSIATAITVDITVNENGNAQAGVDFDASGVMSPFTLEPNTAMAYFSVAIIEDEVALEGSEGIVVIISNPQPSSVNIINSQVSTDIIDNDVVTVGFGAASATTSEGVGEFTMCVVKDRVTGFAIDVTVTDIPGTATEQEDYIFDQPLNLQLGTNDFRTCFNISIIDDDVFLEGTESFSLNISHVFSTAQNDILLSPSMTTIFIEDNDINPVIGFTDGPRAYPEDRNVMLCIGKVSPSIVVDITVDITISSATAVAGDDYTASTDPPSPLTLGTEDDSICFTIPLIDDDIALEGAEELSVTLSNPVPSSVTINPSVANVTIVDNDVVTVGFGSPSATVSEGDGQFMMCVVKDKDTAVAVPFTVRDIPGTANESSDYSYNETAQYVLGATSDRTCFSGSIIDDMVAEPTEDFDLSLTVLAPSVRPSAIVDPNITTILILDDDAPPPSIFVNNTVVGDPFFTAPVNIDPTELGLTELVSLCYEIHGRPSYTFNLVNDECTVVNARYFRPHPGIDINVMNTIAVRAVDDDGDCQNIQVDLSGCSASINSIPINTTYQSAGITVRRYPGRVRIAVPNCDNTQLVMWVFCQSGVLNNPSNGEEMATDMIRFVIARGVSLTEESHGLLGQFWNVPFAVEDYLGDKGRLNPDYKAVHVTYRPGNAKSREFVSLLEPLSWDRTKQPCLYSGNRQGGPIGDIDSGPNDSVIEGSYMDYRVSSLFASDCLYCTMFDDTQC